MGNRWDKINDKGEFVRDPGGSGATQPNSSGDNSWIGCCCVILIILAFIGDKL